MTDHHQINPNDPYDDRLVPVLRWMANIACLWGLCAQGACRRAQSCRRDPRDCLSRFALIVPDDARAGIKEMLKGRDEDLSYDAVKDRAYDLVEAVEDWQARVAHATRPRGA